jgi:error-prone DNA polymerase
VQSYYASTVYNSVLLLVRGVLRRTGPRGVSIRATGCWDLGEMFTLFQQKGITEVRKVIELSPKQKPNPYKSKAGGMSMGRRTLLTQESEMIEL